MPSMAEFSDGELVARVLAGDDSAYAELVRRHHPRVIGLCRSMLSTEQAAEDAAQDAFLKAYRSLASFRADASFATWLYRIAANQCLDCRRKEARGKEQSLDALVEDHGDRIQALSATPGPERSAEDVELVRRVLSALPEQYRLILTLREVQGLDYAEIAQTMECSLDSVKARLKRARRTFLDKLRHLSGAGGV